ncbi:MAG: hypothetical protein ACFFDN_45095 [Candidatus Hodarchaeota archaeon]
MKIIYPIEIYPEEIRLKIDLPLLNQRFTTDREFQNAVFKLLPFKKSNINSVFSFIDYDKIRVELTLKKTSEVLKELIFKN